MSDVLSVVSDAKAARLIHVWVSTAEGKWSKRSETLKLLLKLQVEVLSPNKMAMEAKQEKSRTHGVSGIGPVPIPVNKQGYLEQ